MASPGSDAELAADAPLVLEHGLLYLRRYREYERRLALGLQRIAAQPLPGHDPAALSGLFAQLLQVAIQMQIGLQACYLTAGKRHLFMFFQLLTPLLRHFRQSRVDPFQILKIG